MFLARVTGTVIASRKVESLEGQTLQVIQPVDEHGEPVGAALVAVDTVQAGVGELVFYVPAREAILPLADPMTPIDAAIVGIVDTVSLPRQEKR